MDMKLNERGLMPAIAQDIDTGQVLMMGYMSPGALKRTLEGGQVWYYSRSREDLWHKGEVSGNYLNLKEAWVDCDSDTILMKVTPDGPTCHTGEPSCFFTPLDGMPEGFHSEEASADILEELFSTIQERKRDLPEGSYTAELLRRGIGSSRSPRRHRQPSRRSRRPPLSHPSPAGRLRRHPQPSVGRTALAPTLNGGPLLTALGTSTEFMARVPTGPSVQAPRAYSDGDDYQ